MKKKRKIFFCLILLSILILPTLHANAALLPPYGAYKLTWNIQSIYYYIDGSAPGYSGTIKAAAQNWVYTGHGYNKLYPNTQTTNKSGSAIDFYAEYNGKDHIAAYTVLYKKVNGSFVTVSLDAVGLPKDNYSYAEIHINNDEFDNINNFNVRQGIIAHEFGHVWGLAHTSIENSIMYADTSRPYTVQQIDNDAFNQLYK